MPMKKINDTRLFYEESGSGEAIIFHHGYTGAHDVWLDEISPRLNDSYRCIVMDCRGAGDSEHPETGYNIPQYAADVIAVADALELEEFTYVGHSMGGGIGYQLGINHGERLKKLVLVAPIPSAGIKAPRKVHEKAKETRSHPDARDLMIADRLLLRLRAPKEVIIKTVDRALSVSAGHFDESWQSMLDFNVQNRLDELRTPTLMIAGAADGLCAANVNDWQRLPMAALHVFSRVGHGIPREVPEEFSAVLRDFLEHGVVNAATQQKKLEDADQHKGN